jgi:hypothetical protein
MATTFSVGLGGTAEIEVHHRRCGRWLPVSDQPCTACAEVVERKVQTNRKQPVLICDDCGGPVFDDDSQRNCFVNKRESPDEPKKPKCTYVYHKNCGRGWDNRAWLCPHHKIQSDDVDMDDD